MKKKSACAWKKFKFHISKCVSLNILYLHMYLNAKVYVQTYLETITFYCTVLQLYLFGKEGGRVSQENSSAISLETKATTILCLVARGTT